METITNTRPLCDVCNKDIHKEPRLTRKYDDLYLSILQVGQRRVNHGISYSYLLEELSKKGFDIYNGCIEIAIKHWFCNAYYHVLEKGKFCEAQELEDHSSCSFILSAESSLLLLEHEKVSKTIKLMWLTIIASIIIGIATIVVSWYLTYHPKEDVGKQVEKQKIKVPQQSIISVSR